MGSGSLEGRGRAIPRPDGGGVGERPAGQSWVDPGARLAGGSSPGRTEPEKPVGCRFVRSVSGRRCARPARSGICSRPKPHHKLPQSIGSLRREHSSNHLVHRIDNAMSCHSRVRDGWHVARIDAISRQDRSRPWPRSPIPRG
jgi:hypothetical protein